MEQEKLIWQLQEFVQEEYLLRKKSELKPLVEHLKKLREDIKRVEAEADGLQRQAAETERKAQELEKKVSLINKQIKGGKEKLYGAKGSSLKELLSLQQSVLKKESEAEKGEVLYWEMLKKAEELRSGQKQAREAIKQLKREYNDNVKVYREKLQQIELKLAENRLKQEKIREKLKPEVLSFFQEVEKKFPGNPVAVVKGGACSGCHIAMPSILVGRIREGGKIYRCENCGRILINILEY
ncbi:MAG: C4-type zinc ribbon domain-containing protein [Peptococcaceae bacterium]|jgi:predicted  nucleic acid-binding Zn-ribbon protein|nr:C4-type zinc ribbon domain-containing protein [Peptococcaceae bacterium]MDH7526275.1 C4-type zinc ribbon domain-containing protein [Peptococcaceae bacterium]